MDGDEEGPVPKPSGGSAKGDENKLLLSAPLEALGVGSALSFCGVSSARGAGLACAA